MRSWLSGDWFYLRWDMRQWTLFCQLLLLSMMSHGARLLQICVFGVLLGVTGQYFVGLLPFLVSRSVALIFFSNKLRIDQPKTRVTTTMRYCPPRLQESSWICTLSRVPRCRSIVCVTLTYLALRINSADMFPSIGDWRTYWIRGIFILVQLQLMRGSSTFKFVSN